MPAIAAAAGPSSVPRSTWVPNGPVSAVEVVGDRAYIAGDFRRVGPYGGSFPRIHRTTGEAQQGWPEVVGSVSAVESDGAGGWFIGGTFVAVGGVPRAGLAHVLPGGSVDPAFAPAMSGGVKALLRIGATLYVGGDFTAINGEARSRLGAVDAATGAPTAFAPAMNGEVRALAGRRFASTTTIWAGGFFSAVGGSSRSAVAGFTNGELNGYAPVINGYVEALELDGLTGMYIGGHFTTVNGAGRTGVARVTGETGTTTSPFAADVGGAGGDTVGPVVHDIERTSGSVYLAGDFERVNSGSRPNLAAVDPVTGALTSWTPAVAPAAPNTQLSDVLVDPAVPDTVFAGGFGFGVRAYNATTGARSAWAPLDPGSTIVEAVAVDGNSVVVGGVIDVVGGVARNRFAELDLVTGRATALDIGLNQIVFDMARRGTTLYLAGAFSRTEGPGGRPQPGTASFDTARGRWTDFVDAAGTNDVIAVAGNTVWTASGRHLQGYRDDVPGSGNHVPLAEPGVLGPVPDIRALTGTDDTLFIGGDFTHLVAPDGQATHARANLAAIRPDGEILPWNPGANDEVTAIAPAGSTVFAGGKFTTAGGAARTALAGLDATTGAATSFVSGDSATPTALGPLDGELLVARESDPLLSALDSLTGVPGSWHPGAHTSLRTPPAEDILVSRERGVLVGGRMAVGLGPVRTVNLAIFPLSPPPPTRVAATAGDGQATVSFTTPGDGGSPITGYGVTASPGGATATGGSSPIVVSGLQNGTEYTFTVTATNAVGTSPPSKPSAPIAPAVAPVAPPGPAPPGAESPSSIGGGGAGGGAAIGTADRTPPLLRSFSARPKRFAGRAGTRLRVRLSEPARVRFELLARSRGRRVGRRCRPQTRANRRRRPCTRLVRRAQLVRRVGAAPPAVRFRAARARPGRYTLRATPTDAAGNVGRARSIAVVVLRSRSRR